MSVDYDTLTIEELAQIIATSTDDEAKLKAITALNSKNRQLRDKIKDDIKKSKEDSIAHKKALKETKDILAEQQKGFTHAYKELNAMIRGVSLVKHFDEFETKVVAFQESCQGFNNALNAHADKIAELKGLSSE